VTNFVKNCIALTAAMFILAGCTTGSNLSGGIDVGNPGKIAGVVKAANNKVVPRAMVILGYDMILPKTLKATDTVIRNGLGFIFKLHYFDTIFTDEYGAFSFDSLYLRDYVVAVKAPGLAGVEYVSVTDGSAEATVSIELTKPSVVTIIPAVKGDTSFSIAGIAGIPYQARVDSSGTIRFDSLPSGIRTLILYGRDDKRFVFDDVRIKPETNAVLVADASIPVADWVFKNEFRAEDLPPYVYKFGRWNNQVSIWDSSAYDIYIQFSHTMDPITTLPAIQAISEKSSLKIDKVRWYSNDIILLRLCVADSNGLCDKLLLEQAAPWTFKINTGASSLAGHGMTWTETVKIQ
jgi:hypothetical protein